LSFRRAWLTIPFVFRHFTLRVHRVVDPNPLPGVNIVS
jgi:hypothetical protein